MGKKELDLLRASAFAAFPATAKDQPVFYPVLDEDYAVQIARDWNTKDPKCGFAGYVTRFKVKESFIAGYPVHVIAGAKAREYWIPSEDMEELNAALMGPIEVIHSFRGAEPR